MARTKKLKKHSPSTRVKINVVKDLPFPMLSTLYRIGIVKYVEKMPSAGIIALKKLWQ